MCCNKMIETDVCSEAAEKTCPICGALPEQPCCKEDPNHSGFGLEIYDYYHIERCDA